MKGQISTIALSAAFLAISQCWAESSDTPHVHKNDKVGPIAGFTLKDSLKYEYAQFEKKRISLEDERAEYEKKMSTLEDDRRSVEQEYAECTSVQWRSIWKKTMEDAEKERRELENINRELEQLNDTLDETNVELDKERLAIEKSHRIKGPIYEDEIRIWMKKVNGEYFSDLKNKLFRGYKEYMNGIERYISFVKGAITKCNNKEYAEPITEAVFRLIPEITSGIKSLVDIFRKDH